MLDRLATELGSEDRIVERIRHAMLANGWSQQDLADRVTAQGFPMHQSSVSRLLAKRGRRSVPVDEALAIAKALGLTMAELLLPGDALVAEATLRALRDAAQLFGEQERAREAWEHARQLLIAFVEMPDGDLPPGWAEMRDGLWQQLDQVRQLQDQGHRHVGWMADVVSAMEGEQ